jgi:arylsulfatase A-like enzyme
MRTLILDLDTLRPDHLGCYGYVRDTSPNIDRIAAEGVRFDEYYCSDAPCLPSRAALVSGQFGIRTGVVGHGGTAADMRIEGSGRGFRTSFSAHNLWSLFRKKGMWVASFSPFAERHSAWWFQAGTNECFNTGKGGKESAEEITPSVLDWLGRNARRDNWVLHVNYWDPHTHYRAPAEFGNPFKGAPLPEWMNEEIISGHNRGPGGHGSMEINMFDDKVDSKYPRQPGSVRSMADFRRMIDGYDCGIRYMDGHIGRILDAISSAGVLDDLAIVVTSDHGENLGELNCYAEHGTADRITHRIPMIVKMPGCVRGHVDGGLHYNLDLIPTLAEMFGAEPSPEWDGRSYAETLVSGADCGRESLVLGQCCHGAMRGVRFGPWLYMRIIHDFYHLYPPEMLFNVEDDPHEEKDIAMERRDICDMGARILLDWHDGMMKRMPDAIDPLWTVMREGGPEHSRGNLPEYVRRLEQTGRGHAVAELKRRHPQEFGKA